MGIRFRGLGFRFEMLLSFDAKFAILCLMNTKCNFLIAEDDAVLRDLYIRKFSKSDFDIRTAANGQETLDKIKEKAPDLLLLDINMPVLDGFGVLEKLPKETRGFPVIAITNFEDDATREKMRVLGVDGYFVKKDMTIKSLMEMVEGLLKYKK